MSRAFKYLARELAKSYLLIGAALLVLFDLLAFLTESQDIGDAHYTVLDAILVVLYSTPALLVDLSPFIALLGTLNAYDRLNATSEIIALRAAGVTGLRLSRIAGLLAGAFMIVIAGVEVAARPLRLDASVLRIQKTAPTGNLLRRSGFWIRSGSMYVNVSALENAEGPSDIRMFDFTPDAHLESYLRAKSATIVNAGLWRLEDVWRKRYSDNGAPAAPQTIPSLNWKPLWDQTRRLYDVPISSYTIGELISRSKHRTNEVSGGQNERLELWRRLTLPLAAIAYALLAAPFALLSNIRGGRSARLAIGAALAFLIYVGQQVVSNAGILAGLSIPVTSAVPPMLVLVLALLLMRRMN